MKRVGYILICIGLLGIAFGVGSFVYPALQRPQATSETSRLYRDADGDPRPYVVAERFICGVGGGTVAILVGAYFSGSGRRKKEEREMA